MHNDRPLIESFRSIAAQALSSCYIPNTDGYILFHQNGALLSWSFSRIPAINYPPNTYMLEQKTGFVFISCGYPGNLYANHWEFLTANLSDDSTFADQMPTSWTE